MRRVRSAQSSHLWCPEGCGRTLVYRHWLLAKGGPRYVCRECGWTGKDKRTLLLLLTNKTYFQRGH